MNDREFVAASESTTLPELHHRDHVRAAWCYLTWRPSILDRLYRPDTIRSARARCSFVLPDAARA